MGFVCGGVMGARVGIVLPIHRQLNSTQLGLEFFLSSPPSWSPV